MKTSMTLFRAIEIACKSLMSSGAFNQDERAAAYDVLANHSAHLHKMLKTDSITFNKEESKAPTASTTTVFPIKPKAEANKWTHLYNGSLSSLRGKRCRIICEDALRTTIEVEDTRYHRHILNDIFKTFPTINGVGVFEAFSQKHEENLKNIIEGLNFNDKPVNIPMTTCFEIINSTESMNDAGFFDGMKFVPVTGSITLRNSYMLEHIRSGKTCRIPAKFVREIQIPTAKVNALINKRGMKKYDF